MKQTHYTQKLYCFDISYPVSIAKVCDSFPIKTLLLLMFAISFTGCGTSEKKQESLTQKQQAQTQKPVVQLEEEKNSPQHLSNQEKKQLSDNLYMFYKGKQQWREAKQKIIAMGPIGIQALCVFFIRFFASSADDSRLWNRAKRELAELKEEAIPYLIIAMSNKNMGTTGRMQCSQTLVMIGKASTPSLVKNLKTGDKSFRRIVLETLNKIGDPKAAAPIAKLYLDTPQLGSNLEEDPNFDIRYYSMKALTTIKSEEALEAIDKGLSDPAVVIRRLAITAAAQYNSAAAQPMLKKALEVSKIDFSGYYKRIKQNIK